MNIDLTHTLTTSVFIQPQHCNMTVVNTETVRFYVDNADGSSDIYESEIHTSAGEFEYFKNTIKQVGSKWVDAELPDFVVFEKSCEVENAIYEYNREWDWEC